jgi:hypothetical protein
LPDARRGRLVGDLREPVRDPVERDFVGRDLLDVDLAEDFFERDRWDLVSPFSRRILLTVRAATSSARRP